MAKKSIITTSYDPNAGLLFTVDGVTQSIILPVAQLADEIRDRAMIHGLVQKVSDAAAIPKDEDGNPATPEAKHAAMSAVVSRLLDGDWSKRSETGESQPSGLIFRALYAVAVARAAKAKKPAPSEEAVRAMYDAKDRKAQLAMRNVPEIAAEMERIKAERGGSAAKVNVDDLLGELDL